MILPVDDLKAFMQTPLSENHPVGQETKKHISEKKLESETQ